MTSGRGRGFVGRNFDHAYMECAIDSSCNSNATSNRLLLPGNGG